MGANSHLHATIFPHHSAHDRYCVECIADISDSHGESWTYGQTMPLTFRMAHEIAGLWCNGRKVPRKYEWR
jgi:hypothetical protein